MVKDENKLILSAAAQRAPGRPHASTLWRWCRGGIRGVKLEYLRVGRRIVTSQEAMDRFFERVTAADRAAYTKDHPTASPQSSLTHRDKAVDSAEAELRAAGI